MAVALHGFSWRPRSSSCHPFLFFCVEKIRSSCTAAIHIIDDPDFPSGNTNGSAQMREGNRASPKWRKLNSKELGISNSMIPKPTRVVLNGLRRKGYDVYLVGGCVRDLVLKRTPKDFDILTSAELRDKVGIWHSFGSLVSISRAGGLISHNLPVSQDRDMVMKTFGYCRMVGRRFPICHVHIGESIVEVSSFSTNDSKSYKDWRCNFGAPIGCDDEDYVRWRNCLHRDFTINGLMFDPYAKLVYDYNGGLLDVEKAKVRTIISARSSFREDAARILRAIRIAARLKFRLARETAQSIKGLAELVPRIDKGRLLMEMNYMLAYGSAEASLRLLWKYGLLEILLPMQAAYFARQGFLRRDGRSNMLLALFSNLDKLLGPDRPCNDSLWLLILAFHKAVWDKPRDPLVVATFSLAVNNGGNMSEAAEIAARISLPYDSSFGELVDGCASGGEGLKMEALKLAESIEMALYKMMDRYAVSGAMASYPGAPCSDVVFIPFGLVLRVCKIIECVKRGEVDVAKKGSEIDYERLALGCVEEVRHVFARLVFDTVYPLTTY